MINYLIGDATEPKINGIKFIIHCCNSIGGWGAGFTGALSKKWKQPEELYRLWHKKGRNCFSEFKLGKVQFIQVEKDIFVANMIAQEGIDYKNGIPPVRYEALRECLKEVNLTVNEFDSATIHCPRICTGLAGGDWTIIEQIIKDTMSVDVYVYDLPKIE